jgi:succinoglycan biosynthesis protein ExoL
MVYEVADIQSVLLRRDPAGMLLRALERWCLRRTDMVVYTSGHFMTRFLRPVQHCSAPALLLENKIYPATALPARAPAPPRKEGPIVVGYLGQLRCTRSLEMIGRLAAAFRGKVRFVLWGYPNHQATGAFRRTIAGTPNVSYEGPYRNPDDLARIYSSVDLCWGFDFCCPGLNSSWCLTNRLYEAGYFGVPILVEDETAAGEFVRRLDSGWSLGRPLEESLHKFLGAISPREIQAKQAHTAAIARDAFVLDGQMASLRQAFLPLAAWRDCGM